MDLIRRLRIDGLEECGMQYAECGMRSTASRRGAADRPSTRTECVRDIGISASGPERPTPRRDLEFVSNCEFRISNFGGGGRRVAAQVEVGSWR
jgi:hypothetical protein